MAGADRGHGPFVVTLGFDPETFGRLDALRSRYFPPGRNFLPAHLSLFHSLPTGEGEEIGRTLAEVAAASGPIPLRFPGIFRLGRGVALRVEAPGLSAVHKRLATAFGPWLTPQDRQPFRPHVTVMNKAEKAEAELAFATIGAGWEPWEGLGTGLLLWTYEGGPWDSVAEYRFGGGSGTTAGGRDSGPP